MSVLVGAVVADVAPSYAFPQVRGQSCAGPFRNGQNVYVVYGITGGSALPLAALRIFKSTDGGLTWAEKNTAGAPVIAAGSRKTYAATQSGTKLFICWQKDSGGTAKLQMVSFDMSTDLYGVNVQGPDTFLGANPSTVFAAGGYPDFNYEVLVKDRGDGNLVVVYASEVGLTLDTSYATFNIAGNTWGANQVIAHNATIDQVPHGLYIDPAKRSYVILVRVDNAGVITLQVVVVNSANAVVSGPTLVSGACFQPLLGSAPAATCIYGGFTDLTNNQVTVGRVNAAGHLAISTAPFADAPVWTDHDSTAVAFTDNFTLTNNQQMAQALPDGPNVTVVYYDNGTGTGNGDANLQRATFNVGAGTWGAPVLQILDAVAGLGATSQIASLSAAIGSILFTLAASTAFGPISAVFGVLGGGFVGLSGNLTIRFGGLKVYS